MTAPLSPSNDSDWIAVLYQDLRRLAAEKMKHEKPGHTLQATALVHEAWLKLRNSNKEWESRSHFFSAAAESMRRILVDNARRKLAAKHGSGNPPIPIEGLEIPIAEDSQSCLEISDCLDRLDQQHPEKAMIVKLKVFGGMSFVEIAALLEVSEKTIRRRWTFAKAWISKEIQTNSPLAIQRTSEGSSTLPMNTRWND